MSSQHGGSEKPFQRLLGLLRPDFRELAIVAFFSVVVSVLSLAVPMTVEALVNTVAFGKFVQPLAVLSLILFVFLGFGAALRALQTWVAEILQRRLFVRVVAELTGRLTRGQHQAFDAYHGPELVNRFFEVMTVQKAAAALVLDGVAIIVQTVVGMILLAFYHPYLLGFDIGLLLLMSVAILVLGRGALVTATDESYAKYHVAAWLEQLAHFPATARQQVDWATSRTDDLTCDYLETRKQHFRVLMRQICFALALQAVGATVLLGLGGWLVLNGQLTLGQLVAAELVVTVIIGSFAKLGKHLESLYDLLAAVEKLGHLLDIPVERLEGDALPPSEAGMALKLHDLELPSSLGRGAVPVSGHVEAGELVAVTGSAASGKSTLFEVLFGLRAPAGGHVELDGVDLRGLSLRSVREQVAYVKGWDLFEGTIDENIRIGRPAVGLEEVRDSLHTVDLWPELMVLPEGLQTRIQPGGSPLSGSQRSRLILARGVAGRPRLLLIDQTLDALPSAQSLAILEGIRAMLPRTTIILASSRTHLQNQCQRVLHVGGPAALSPHLSPDTHPTPAHLTA